MLSVRAPVGPTNTANQRCCIGRGLAAIRAREGVTLSKYLRYFFRRFEAEIARKGVGSTFTAINRDDIERMKLPVPPLPEQRLIVSLLDEADELRRLRQQADRRTSDLIPALFHEMFGDAVTNPQSWKTSTVGALFPTDRAGARCGPFGSALKKHEYVEEGIPVWGIENVQPNLFVEGGALFITKEKYQQLAWISTEHNSPKWKASFPDHGM